jgi:hypothetical protein
LRSEKEEKGKANRGKKSKKERNKWWKKRYEIK